MPIEEHFIPPQTNEGQIANPEIASLIEALFSDSGATQKTVLTHKQVVRLARAKTFSHLFDIPELATLCEYLMQLKISEKGRGRSDLVKVLQSRNVVDEEAMMNLRQRDKLLGRRQQ